MLQKKMELMADGHCGQCEERFWTLEPNLDLFGIICGQFIRVDLWEMSGLAAPLVAGPPTITCYRALTVPELTQQMFDAKNMMAACDPRWGFCTRFLFFTPLCTSDTDVISPWRLCSGEGCP